MFIPPRASSRTGDVEDVGDVCPQGCTHPTTISDRAENVLNVPNVPEIHDGPGVSPAVRGRRGAMDMGHLSRQGDLVRQIADLLARGYRRLLEAGNENSK